MNQYKMEIYSNVAEDGVAYWTVTFPAVQGCVGGGDTPEQAIAEAQENLTAHLAYLSNAGFPIPASDLAAQEYSGRIALRVAKSTHRKLAERAREEGISTNTLIGNAIEFYFGNRNCNDEIKRQVNQIKRISMQSFVLQQCNARANQELWDDYQESYVNIGSEE